MNSPRRLQLTLVPISNWLTKIGDTGLENPIIPKFRYLGKILNIKKLSELLQKAHSTQEQWLCRWLRQRILEVVTYMKLENSLN